MPGASRSACCRRASRSPRGSRSRAAGTAAWPQGCGTAPDRAPAWCGTGRAARGRRWCTCSRTAAPPASWATERPAPPARRPAPARRREHRAIRATAAMDDSRVLSDIPRSSLSWSVRARSSLMTCLHGRKGRDQRTPQRAFIGGHGAAIVANRNRWGTTGSKDPKRGQTRGTITTATSGALLPRKRFSSTPRISRGWRTPNTAHC